MRSKFLRTELEDRLYNYTLRSLNYVVIVVCITWTGNINCHCDQPYTLKIAKESSLFFFNNTLGF